MNVIQSRLCEMLGWFHSYCEEHNLTYYAVGGTLLGAVRHKGFIPWDDDVDVAMPREDYNRLISLMYGGGNDGGVYVLEQPLSNKDFVYPFCKLYDTRTTLTEHTRYNTTRGLYLDIFPLDGAGDSERESVKIFKKINGKINWLNTKICAVRKGRAFYKNAAIILSRMLPGKSAQRLIRELNEQCSSRSFYKDEYVCNFFGNWYEKELAKREWFGKPELYAFENITVCGPRDAHSYLTRVYGDYMKLPPEEKRVSHHDYVYIDLENSYLKTDK